MRILKYPCIECKKSVQCNQLGIFCSICKLWIHFKCSTLSKAHYDFLATNVNIPYNCHKCRPLLSLANDSQITPPTADETLPTSSNNVCTNDIPSHDADSVYSADRFSDAHSSDFSLESTDENECD